MEEFCFPSASVQKDDRQRWDQEGFRFSKSSPLVLEQHYGGPCAVLAAIQGFILYHRFFELKLSSWTDASTNPDSSLVFAIVNVLDRARPSKESPFIICSNFQEEDVLTLENKEEATIFVESSMEMFQSDGGIISFLCSLVSTRGLKNCRDDMDDGSTGLTGQFGHCTQELLNLLLIGRASSQVHDGDVDLGGGMTLRGVHERPEVGFLTHLEAMRYCQVGSLYKKPIYPVWVVGSESHFTVLFCDDRHVNDESLNQQLKNKVKIAFGEFDQGENGFIAVDKFGPLLGNIGVRMNDMEIADLLSRCEMAGSGIILWNDLWSVIRPVVIPPQDWSCHQCTFINDALSQQCSMCQGIRRPEEETEQELEDDRVYTLQMTHVNGLIKKIQGKEQGPVVTHFEITKVSQDLQAPSTQGHGDPIEEVVQTRWPGCVFSWPSSGPPNING